MVLVQVLKRKDASSIVVAVVVAWIVIGLLSAVTIELTSKISGLSGSQYATSGGGWKVIYLAPVVSAALQLIALEILARLYIWVAKALSK